MVEVKLLNDLTIESVKRHNAWLWKHQAIC